MSSIKINRRAFLYTTALTAATATMAACGGGAPAPTATTAPEPTQAPAEPTATTAAVAEPTATTAAAEPTATTAPEAPASKYQEAPMLAEKVAAGELPPVEERLPKNPLVVPALEMVGQYCDTWRRCETNPGHIAARLGAEPLVTWDRDAKTIIPNLAYKWEVNEDGTEFTFYLREGLRWSDGEPFDANDIMFWYEDVLLNEELTPAFPKWLMSGGEAVVIEKIDDYTVKFVFAAPAGLALDNLAFSGNSIVNYPRHYLEQFHINYADADELAAKTKEAGFESWFQLFGNMVNPSNNPDMPTMRPWKIQTKDWTTTAVGERNPYYWKVDEEGKQLPYFDKVFWNLVQSPDLIPMKVVSGEVDMQAMYIGFPNYTLLMENREAGAYNVNIWDAGWSGSTMFANQTRTGNDEQRDLLRTREFRVALSKAINRDEMNELFYYGLTGPILELYPEKVKNDAAIQDYFVYDVDAANAMLDELGLTERDSDGYRLTPSGQTINMTMFGHASYPTHRDVAEVESEFLKEIGIKTTLDWVAGELWWPRLQESDYDLLCYDADIAPGALFWLAYPRSLFPVQSSTYWASLWGWYYETNGQNGEAPEGDAATLVDMWEEIQVTVDAAARQELVDQAFYIGAQNLWIIPIFGGDLSLCVVKNGFHNVPERGVLAWPVYSPKLYNVEHFWIEQA